jgi:hypothetical protein
MLTTKANLRRVEAAAQARETALQTQLTSANDARKKWRRATIQQLAETRRLEGELKAALERAASAEAAYYGIVNKMLTPPKPPAPLEPIDPEVVSLDRISDETVQKMSEQFVRDGLSPELAQVHAKEIVSLAERAWGGVDV